MFLSKFRSVKYEFGAENVPSDDCKRKREKYFLVQSAIKKLFPPPSPPRNLCADDHVSRL